MTYVVDTWAWVEFFRANPRAHAKIESRPLKTPGVVVAEFSRWLEREGFSEEKKNWALEFIKARSLILELDFEQAVAAGKLCKTQKLDFVDAIIYSYASENQPVLTGDPHFRGRKNVEFIQ